MADGAFRESARDETREAFLQRVRGGDRPFRDGEGAWVITRFEDARAVLLDAARWSSHGDESGFPLLQDDPPRHTALRGLLQKAFTPGRIEALRPEIEETARELVGAIKPDVEADAVLAITSPLPVIVIARMLGVSENDREQFRQWSNRFAGAGTGEGVNEIQAQAMMEMSAYLSKELAKRRVSPGADLISALAQAEEKGVSLTDSEIISLSVLLLIAGNETTTNLMSNMLNRFAAHPEEWAALRRDPALLDTAIEEVLRVDSPVQFTVRFAKEAIDVGGVTISKGEPAFIYLAAANRDPSKWSDPDNLDIARERRQQLAFGLGVHMCIGAPLARLEARAGIAALLARFESVRFGAGERPRTTSALLRGFQTLPLIFA